MIKLLYRLFVPGGDALPPAEARRKYGVICSLTAIGFNILLFAAKQTIGAMSGSLAIRADALNNLTDAGSALLIMLGFRLAGLRPSNDRPFGSGRIEYISGFVVSMLVIMIGARTLESSIKKIIAPEYMVFSAAVLIVLALSILAKLYLALMMRKMGRELDSSALKASSADSLSDMIATGAALLSVLLMHFFGWNLDGWCGSFVALFILKTGVSSAWDTMTLLLGKKPDPALVKQIEDIALSYDEIVGIHDLVVHDYGPGRLMISLHAEVPGDGNIYTLHDAMDRASNELDERLGCESVIHMDPICMDDGRVNQMRETLAQAVRQIDPGITIHDFRLVHGPTHTNIIFDALVPHSVKLTDAEVEARLHSITARLWDDTFAVIKVDRPYV